MFSQWLTRAKIICESILIENKNRVSVIECQNMQFQCGRLLFQGSKTKLICIPISFQRLGLGCWSRNLARY